MKDINHCPFCGETDDLFLAFDDGLFWVECGCCGAHGGTAYGRDSARRCWNMRPKDDEEL